MSRREADVPTEERALARLLFDEFELRLDSGELLRRGSPVKLQPQPAKVLELLAGRAGEVVGREEIRQAVWGDSFLDFDANLNFSIKQIRKALGDSATTPRFVETVPRRGYRFLAPVRVEPAAGGLPSPEPVASSAAPAAPVPHRRRWTWLTGIAAATVALLVLVFLVASRSSLQASAGLRLAVLPVTCQGPSLADQGVCDGITEAITAELAQQSPQDLEVVGPSSSLAYGKSRKDLSEIGRALKATHLLVTTADLSGERLRLNVRLVSAGDRDAVAEQLLETELGDAPLAYEQVVGTVCRALHLAPPAEPGETYRPPVQAYEAYARGLSFLRHGRQIDAAESLRQAVLLAPRFARAWSALARAELLVGLFDRKESARTAAAESHAQRALELDPRLAEAHRTLAKLLLYQHYDWQGAGREYRRALALGPGDPESHIAYSYYLSGLGRHDEALAEIARARELDPASMIAASDYAWLLYMARRYAEAIREARATLGLFDVNGGPLPEEAWAGRVWSYQVLMSAGALSGNPQTALEGARGYLGQLKQDVEVKEVGDYWRDHDRRLRDALRDGAQVPYLALARTAIAVGDPDRALADLEGQCRDRWGNLFVYTTVDPVFDPLRGDPRFTRILDCLGLPKDAPARKLPAPRPRAL